MATFSVRFLGCKVSHVDAHDVRERLLADVITSKLARLPGIVKTYTMVAFEVFSQHDLDAMFSIGA